ncbi:MAG TPA: ribulose-phosphate 3-epimerase [Syntrophobacteraceae bacterium]|nr:ribulose-phosphate 3-epimerase [Syntrophobacteraceae bacterium]
MKKLLSASILSANFGCLAEEVKAVEAAGADWIHVDVMDGHFVPNITIGPYMVKALSEVTSLPLDVHLMIEKPGRYLEDFVKAGAGWLGVHAETCEHLHREIQRIKELGVKAAVALNPATPLCAIETVLPDVDMVLLMTVNPGFGGQAFIANVLPKIRQCRKMIDDAHLAALLQVDGGVNPETAGKLSAAGVDVFVAGSAIFRGDYAENIRNLKAAMNR